MKYFIGIDNSKESHFIVVHNENGKKIRSFEIENRLVGFHLILKKFELNDELYVGMELSHGPIIDFLKNKDVHLFLINPLKIKRHKETLIVSIDKTDSIDAQAIADYVRINHKRLRTAIFNSDELEKLNCLDITYSRLIKDRTKYINRLRHVLEQYFPLYNTLFSTVNSVIFHKFIDQYPTYKILKETTLQEIKIFLSANHYRRTNAVKNLLNKIRNYEQLECESTSLAHSIETASISELLIVLNKKIAVILSEMIKIKKSHKYEKIISSLPGAGDVLGCKILNIFGDNKKRFKSGGDAQCLFGTAPRNYQSGKYHKVLARRACNKPARYTMYQFAFLTIQHSKWARSYYDSYRERNHKHAGAVRALSNKWVKIIFQMLKTETEYNESLKKVKEFKKVA